MSLALPYPSMVFVPLDVLTADEMNHIVANYEFIANQFPITSSNIDSATLFTSQSGQGLGSFVLSDAIENYDKLEIEYFDNSGNRGLKSFRVVPGGTNQTTLTTFQPGFGTDNTFYIQSAIVSFAGINGNVAECRGGAIFSGNYPTVDASSNNNVKILSVVGYK